MHVLSLTVLEITGFYHLVSTGLILITTLINSLELMCITLGFRKNNPCTHHSSVSSNHFICGMYCQARCCDLVVFPPMVKHFCTRRVWEKNRYHGLGQKILKQQMLSKYSGPTPPLYRPSLSPWIPSLCGISTEPYKIWHSNGHSFVGSTQKSL